MVFACPVSDSTSKIIGYPLMRFIGSNNIPIGRFTQDFSSGSTESPPVLHKAWTVCKGGVLSILLSSSWCVCVSGVCVHHGEPPTCRGSQLLGPCVQRDFLHEAAEQPCYQNTMPTLFQDPSSSWKMCKSRNSIQTAHSRCP